jgi:predicted permease
VTLTSKPPRLARWLLARVVPPDVRDEILGDVQEMFDRRTRSRGRPGAALWYWRQMFAFAGHFMTERLRQRRAGDWGLGMSWIDFRLALRMLLRYPGLTVVSVIGMAVAIAIATGAFTIVYGLLDPSLPLDEGERVVSVTSWDAATNNREPRVMRDFALWRDELALVQELGAVRNVTRNLIAPGSQPEVINVAEMSASGFAVARVRPALGRYVLPEDERAGAPEVAVIGHDVWLRRFAGDPGIIGRQIQLGDTFHTVVGVMPEGFAFPVNHSYWIPWRMDPLAYEPRTGPSIEVFGRLAPGATLETAQAELTAIGQRTAAALPKTHEHLRPRVKPYAFGYSDMDDAENYLALHAIQTAIVLLLILICVNVGILVYARTATRQGEIAVRSALGASRRRIVLQLFIEALVLAGVAASVGVGLIAAGLTQLDAALLQLAGRLPFWMHFRLSVEGMLYVVVLTLLAGGLVGVVPALKATGRGVQSRLQGLSAGSGSRMQMGWLWTLLIVAQVAFSVAILPAAIFHAWNSLRFRTGPTGYAAQELLTARVGLDGPGSVRPADPWARDREAILGSRSAELERRLEADPAVSHVTFSLESPGGELAAALEAEGVPAPRDPVDYNLVEGTRQGHFVRFNRVAIDFFDAVGVPVLLGRGFKAEDIDSLGAGPGRGVIVNRTFAERLYGGANALGRRVRYVGRSREAHAEQVVLGRWHEIVGVVPDFPIHAMLDSSAPAVVYHAASPASLYPATLAVRVPGAAPSSFAGRLREVTAAVDPNLQLRGISTTDEIIKREQGVMRLIGITLAAVMLSVVTLSGAGIYALMSFTVARRRKEIGIRAALGADPTRILMAIFSRALGQLAIGAAVGMAGAVGLEQLLEGEMFQGRGAVILPIVAAFMTTVGLLAGVGPARRGLRIQPTEALRAE